MDEPRFIRAKTIETPLELVEVQMTGEPPLSIWMTRADAGRHAGARTWTLSSKPTELVSIAVEGEGGDLGIINAIFTDLEYDVTHPAAKKRRLSIRTSRILTGYWYWPPLQSETTFRDHHVPLVQGPIEYMRHLLMDEFSNKYAKKRCCICKRKRTGTCDIPRSLVDMDAHILYSIHLVFSLCGNPKCAAMVTKAGLTNAASATGDPNAIVSRHCEACNLVQDVDTAERYRPCSRCRSVYYCSTTCQERDRDHHKALCDTFQEDTQ